MVNTPIRNLLYAKMLLLICSSFARVQAQAPAADSAKPAAAHKIRLGSLEGLIINKDQERLWKATISAMDQETGLFIRHALTDGDGRFYLRGIPVGRPVELRVSYSGYLDTSAVFTIKDTVKPLWTGTWIMRELTKELEAVNVTRRKPPFVVKKDTLEFDATQFKTLPTDMVKDLLRKLPGMQIDMNGKVTVNGKPVDRIKVDGRDFMGGNLQSALDNLPGAIIDKVQIMDTRDPGSEATSVVRKPSESLTMNLTLKKNNKIGLLGNAEAAIGNSNLKWGRGFFNAMNGTTRFTVEGAGSNVNPVDRGNTSTDNVKRPSDFDPFGAGEGILQKAWGGAANLSTKFGKKTDLDLTYGGSVNHSRQQEVLDRQTFLSDSSFFFKSNRTVDLNDTKHSLNTSLALPIDSLQDMHFDQTFDYHDGSNRSIDQSQTLTPGSSPINRQDNRQQEKKNGYAIGNSLTYNLSSRDRKTHLMLISRQNWRNDKNAQTIDANSLFYTGTDSSSIRLAQFGDIHNKGFNMTNWLTLKRDLSNRIAALAAYDMSYSYDNNNKDAYRLDSLTGKYSLYDTTYSTHYRNRSIAHAPSVGIGYTGDKLTAELKAGMSILNRNNFQPDRDSTLKIRQKSFSPNLAIGYQWSPYARQDLSYSFYAQQPSPEQLVPAPDNSNPLVVRQGNPGLKSAMMHQLTSIFTYSNPVLTLMFRSQINAAIQSNQIVADNYYDDQGRQVLGFRNAGGVSRIDGNAALNWGRNSRTWNFNSMLATSFVSGIEKGFVNRVENRSVTTGWSPNIALMASYTTKMEFAASATLHLNRTSYSLPGLAAIDYRSFAVVARFSYSPVTGLKWSNSLSYRYNSMIPAGFNPKSTGWNTRLDYSFLKEQRMGVYCLVSDVLNNTNALTRTVSPTEIQTKTTVFLRRCILVGVKFRFNKFDHVEGN